MAKRSVTLDGLAEAINQTIDYSPAIDRIALKLIADTKRNFEASTDPDGKPWAPLKHPRPSGGTPKPLANKGFLRSSVTAPGSKGSIFEKTSTRLLAGTELDYGPIHQYGGTIRPKPPKKFLAIPATREAERIGSPRDWPKGTLTFRFGKNGGVATSTKAKRGGIQEIVQYYFTREVTIPARPFLGISEKAEGEMQMIVADFVQEQIAGEG